MREKLKGFFKKHINDNTVKDTIENSFSIKSEELTYEQWGFSQATKQNGNLLAFSGNLSLVKEEFIKSEHKNQKKIDQEKQNAQNELNQILAENESKENYINQLKDKIDDLKQKKEKLKKEIISIKENPEQILKDKTSKVGFIIGFTILIFLTLYLFIFYSSASYSGFFKNFTEDSDIGNSIFDPQAISKAFKDGATEVILILTIPFIFLGLGYLIHKFQEKKEYIKTTAMILVTLAFDVLLAYKIEKGLYEVERINDPTGQMPPHTMAMAIQSENFWLVIFAGFIVYIIWGFIFDFVMQAYEKLDFVHQAIKAKENEIELYKQEVQKSEDLIHKTKDEINENNVKAIRFKNIINGATIIIDWTTFEKVLLEFVTGWTHWMTNNLPKPLIDNTWKAHRNFIDAHKKEI